MNKDLKDLIINCESEIKNHNPTPRTVCVILQRLIESKEVTNILDLYYIVEEEPKRLLNEYMFGKSSLRYLKEKIYSMFTFKTIVQVERI